MFLRRLSSKCVTMNSQVLRMPELKLLLCSTKWTKLSLRLIKRELCSRPSMKRISRMMIQLANSKD
jgi:hypothetical protein